MALEEEQLQDVGSSEEVIHRAATADEPNPIFADRDFCGYSFAHRFS